MAHPSFIRIEAQLAGIHADIQLLVALTAAVPDSALAFVSVRELVDLVRAGTIPNRAQDISVSLSTIMSHHHHQPKLDSLWADLNSQKLLAQQATLARDQALAQLKSVTDERDAALEKVNLLQAAAFVPSTNGWGISFGSHQVTTTDPTGPVSESLLNQAEISGRTIALQSIANNTQSKSLPIKAPSSPRLNGLSKSPAFVHSQTPDPLLPASNGHSRSMSDSGFSIITHANGYHHDSSYPISESGTPQDSASQQPGTADSNGFATSSNGFVAGTDGFAQDDWNMDPMEDEPLCNGTYHTAPEEEQDYLSGDESNPPTLNKDALPPIPLHREFYIDPALVDDEPKYNEAIELQTTGLLNKLTLSNVEVLKPKFLFATKYPSAIRMLSKTMIHRIQRDTHLVSAISDLVEYVIKHIPLPVMTPTLATPELQDQVRIQYQDTVRRIMIYACEMEYAGRPKGWAAQLRERGVFALEHAPGTQQRTQCLAIARLIGELSGRRIITSKVVTTLMNTLLVNEAVGAETEDEAQVLEDLEFVIALVHQIGDRMDAIFGCGQVDEWFLLLESVACVGTEDVRVLARIHGLLAFREGGWVVDHATDDVVDVGSDCGSPSRVPLPVDLE